MKGLLRLSMMLLIGLLVTSCVTNSYSSFYTPRVSEIFEKTKECKHYNYTAEYLNELVSKGYTIIGTSNFEGALQGESYAVKQGKNIGADIVLTSAEYTRTEQGTRMVPLYTPGQTSSVTTYNSGTANAYGSANVNVYGSGGYASGSGTSSASATYNGTSTSYYTSPGTTTFVPLPYSIPRYKQNAIYLRAAQASTPPSPQLLQGWGQLQKAMTKVQVTEILGEPKARNKGKYEYWYYSNDTINNCYVYFDGDFVHGWANPKLEN